MKVSLPWFVAGTLGGVFLGKFLFSFPGPRAAADRISAGIDTVLGRDAQSGAAIDDELNAVTVLPTVRVIV